MNEIGGFSPCCLVTILCFYPPTCSVRQLVSVLGGYSASIPTLMGEVYGYKAHLGDDGSAYVTGGGG